MLGKLYEVALGYTQNWFLWLEHSHQWTTSQKTTKCHSTVNTWRLQCLSNLDCMESDISFDNDTEPSWMKGWKISIKDLDKPLTSLIGLFWVLFLGTWEGVSSLTGERQRLNDKTIRVGLHAILFLRHSPLFCAAGNQVTFSAIETCWWLDGIILIKPVLSWPRGAETICMVVSRILFWIFSVILSTSLVSKPLWHQRRRNSTGGLWSWRGFSTKFNLWLNENSSANRATSSNVSAFFSSMNVRTSLWMHLLNSSI